MALRYLAESRPGSGPLPAVDIETAEADCTFRGQAMRLRETADVLQVCARGEVVYRWHKGMPWAEVAQPEFWLQ
jgi:hypothetical protein